MQSFNRDEYTSIAYPLAARKSLPFVHILVLLSAFLNAMLRINPESDITAFRILLPIILLYLAMYEKIRFSYLLACIFYVFIFQVISMYLSPYNINNYNMIFILNYMTMLVVGFYIYSLDRVFNWKSIDKFFTYYFYILLVVLLMQLAFGISFPNIPDADGALNGWYGNENDASLALTAFIFYSAKSGALKKHALGCALACIIIQHNGSRTCMLAIAILMCYLASRRFGVPVAIYLALLMSAALAAYLQYFVGEAQALSDILEFINNLIISIENILTGQVLEGVVTSLDVRSVAAVLALMDFASHPLFGIGSGNSIVMVESNGDIFNDVIKSIHNMPLMMLVELGIFGIGIFAFCIIKASFLNWRSFIFWVGIFLLASLSQSGGFIANFFVLVTFVIVVTRPEATANEWSSGHEGHANFPYFR